MQLCLRQECLGLIPLVAGSSPQQRVGSWERVAMNTTSIPDMLVSAGQGRRLVGARGSTPWHPPFKPCRRAGAGAVWQLEQCAAEQADQRTALGAGRRRGRALIGCVMLAPPLASLGPCSRPPRRQCAIAPAAGRGPGGPGPGWHLLQGADGGGVAGVRWCGHRRLLPVGAAAVPHAPVRGGEVLLLSGAGVRWVCDAG